MNQRRNFLQMVAAAFSYLLVRPRLSIGSPVDLEAAGRTDPLIVSGGTDAEVLTQTGDYRSPPPLEKTVYDVIRENQYRRLADPDFSWTISQATVAIANNLCMSLGLTALVDRADVQILVGNLLLYGNVFVTDSRYDFLCLPYNPATICIEVLNGRKTYYRPSTGNGVTLENVTHLSMFGENPNAVWAMPAMTVDMPVPTVGRIIEIFEQAAYDQLHDYLAGQIKKRASRFADEGALA